MDTSIQHDIPRETTILIVDDKPTNIHILAQALKNKHIIQVATNGADALDIINGDTPPDLVLLDVMMPGMDGYQVCQRIKQNPHTWHIPVIFVTAKDDESDQQYGFNLGAEDYITKPFKLPLVIARIKVHLRLKLKSERLEKIALEDGLTDIPNRRALEEVLFREGGRSQREQTPLALVLLDVDHFKAFNDHYGHGRGDECLQVIAKTLHNSLYRPADFVGRYGGEEFLAILPNCDSQGAQHIADILCQKVANLNIPHQYSSAATHVTISLGFVSQIVSSEAMQQEMLQQADQALYAAKHQGRNRALGFHTLAP